MITCNAYMQHRYAMAIRNNIMQCNYAMTIHNNIMQHIYAITTQCRCAIPMCNYDMHQRYAITICNAYMQYTYAIRGRDQGGRKCNIWHQYHLWDMKPEAFALIERLSIVSTLHNIKCIWSLSLPFNNNSHFFRKCRASFLTDTILCKTNVRISNMTSVCPGTVKRN